MTGVQTCALPISAGVEIVESTDLAREDMAEAIEDAFRYDRLVLATTTYNADMFPFMKTFLEELKERGYKNRKIAMIENGSWAPTAAKFMKAMLEGSKDITLVEPISDACDWWCSRCDQEILIRRHAVRERRHI